jgi:dipeptidyl aminopeptidase/acylaminoacyl peptidase
MRRLFVLLLAALPLAAQYRIPPKELVDVVDAQPTPGAIPSPDGKWLLLIQQPAMLTIEDLSQAELKLAGIRFNPETHDQTRVLYATSLTLAAIAGGASRPITGVPAAARMRHPAWSPDASKLAFTVSTPAGVELWVADVAGASARRVGGFVVNQSLGRPFEWMPDSRSLLVAAVPSGRSAAPAVQRLPEGPAIQESHGRKTPAPTYEDMLQNESDAAMFEYHMQAVLTHVPLEGGQPATVVPSSLLLRFSPSPDGRFVLVESIHRPFSYTVPLYRFPEHIAIWSLTGQGGQRVREIADLPLADQVPTSRDAVRTGPRDAEWRADKPAVLLWAEALDGGNPRKEVPARDRLLTLGEPFTGAPATLFDVPLRYDSIRWSSDDLALVRSDRWKDRKTQTWRIRPGHPETAADLIFDRSSEDRYSDPGTPLSMSNAAGQEVLRLAGDAHSIFLEGGGASPEGARPFLDRFDVDAKKATRLFHSEAPYYEAAVDVLDPKGTRFLTRRETATEPPNYVLHDGKAAPRALTAFTNPLPELAKASKEVIHYKRADGVDLNATLYLPSGYDAKRDGPLPVVMWAYPAEFKSAAAASQVTTSQYRFTRAPAMGSPIFFVLRGYAVLDNPTIPIVGEGNAEPNDTYVEQLVAGAKAAVDELVRRGVGDRDRMAITGHSYGAFMTANLLAHSDLFRAGIARSGAYNRTLTPFSFQAEERSYWEAADTYTRMSPFTYANKIHDPILLIHGEEDDNTGTFPIQSERLYAAISGLGGTVRLVMLPKEAHGYRARETALHVLWEMDQWLDKYVKNAPKRAPGEPSKSAP